MTVQQFKETNENKKEKNYQTDNDCFISNCINISERDQLSNHGLCFLLNKKPLEKLCSIFSKTGHKMDRTGHIWTIMDKTGQRI